MPAADGVGQEHPQLTVVDLPGGAGVLPLHPGRAAALLDEPGVVDDEHPASRSVAELVQHVAAHVVADPVDVPVRGPQQPLHPVRGHRTGVLGQRPPVLALQARQQTRAGSRRPRHP